MNTFSSNLRIIHRFWIIIALAVTAMAVLLASSLTTFKHNLLEDRKLQTRHVVETAHSLIGHFHTQESQGVLSREQAQAAAIAAVKALRYEEKDYFWINDMAPTMVMHPYKPQLDGKDLSQSADPNGKRLFVAFVDEVKRNGAGFVDYYWEKPGATTPVAKISYVKGFEPWGWVIGSGIYVDDVERLFWREARTAIGALAIVAILLMLASTRIVRSVTAPLETLQKVIQHVSDQRDLSRRSRIERGDEVGRMARDFDRMMERIQGFVAEVGSSVQQLATAADQLRGVTAETTQGVMEQRSQTDQVATAMNEMSSTVQEVARSASQAAAAAREADTETAQGRRVVTATIDAIDALAREVEDASGVIARLESDTAEISRVLEVIRGIAEQTNLLALNAAIEAARAGEQGRGFAVVADEVRTLASRTQQSTQEIQSMIETLQGGARNAVSVMERGREQAHASVEQAAHAGNSLEGIARAVTRISDMNTQIASAAEEQSAVAEEINRNIVSISAVADRTAAGADQTASAGKELGTIAHHLKGLADQYRT